MANSYIQTTSHTGILTKKINDITLIERLEAAFRVPPSRPDNHIVYTTYDYRGVDFRFIDGGRLFSNLELNQADSTYSVKLKLDSLNLDIIGPYVKDAMYISALHGFLSNDILIKGDMRNIMNLSVSGINRIFDFQLLDTLQRRIFSFDDLSVDFDTLLLNKNRLSVNSIKMTKPFILLEMIDSTNNWFGLMKPEPAEQQDTLKAKADTSAIQHESLFAFKKMEISNGKINLADRTLRFPFNYSIDDIMISSSPDTRNPGWIDVSMTAGLNGTGNFKADFALNPQSTSDLDISVSIGQFRMKDMEAYFRHYFGFPVTGGRMNFTSQNRLRSNSLVSNNSLFFRKFSLGKKSEDKTEYNIPLRLALGVMSDKDGIIDVKTPVEMKGEDVKVGNIRKIVFHAIGTLFVKAAVSPFKMIADLVQVDAESLKEIHLLLTERSPDKKNMETVDILADVLNKKPRLNIDFVYCIDPGKTSDTLAHMMVLEDYARSGKISVSNSSAVSDSTLSKYILEKLSADSLMARAGLNELCRKYVGDEKLKYIIDSLKNSQITFLGSYLSNDKMIPADRYQIITVMPDSIKYDEPVPSFRTFFISGD
jgi:hypothetical protein